MSVTAHDFVGRRDELEIIEQAICGNELRVICIHGAGGIGKTSILREITRQYMSSAAVFVTHIIDFYKPGTHTALGLMRRIADDLAQVERDIFETFYEACRDFEKMSAAGVSAARLHDIEKQVNHEFFTCCNLVAEKLRLVILVDTVEMIQEAPVIAWLEQNVSRFSNTVLILAGRRNDELYQRIAQWLGDGQSRLISLRPFSPTETQELFAISDVGEYLPATVRDKVQILHRGHPILLALSLDCGKKSGQVEELTPTVAQYTITQLQAMDDVALAPVRDQFEKELVESLFTLESESRLFVSMAYIHRRFDAEILAFLEDIGEAEAQAKIQNIRDYPFVKYFEYSGECYLHDEMRRLVVQHVCQKIDLGWGLRTEWAQKMAELTTEERQATRQLFEGGASGIDPRYFSYYGQKLWAINQQMVRFIEQKEASHARFELTELHTKQHIMQAERVYYWLTADQDVGLALYREAFVDDVVTHQREARELKQAERNLAITDLTWKYSPDEYLLEEAIAALLIESDRDKCLKILNDLEPYLPTNVDLGESRQISKLTFPIYYWTYKSYAYSESDIEQGLQAAKGAIEWGEKIIAIANDVHWLLETALARACHALAYVNRLAEQYAQSVHFYQKSLQYNRSGCAIMLHADTLNSMAYVYGLLDQSLTARPLCERALVIRQRLGQEYSLGLSYSTLGAIYLFDNRPDMAEAKCSVAMSIFESLGDEWGLGLVYTTLARVKNIFAERMLKELRYLLTEQERNKILELVYEGYEYAQSAEKYLSTTITRLAEVHQTMASLSLMQARAVRESDEKAKCLHNAHKLYTQAQDDYAKSGIHLEQAFMLERWSRIYYEQKDYEGWIERIKGVEKIAIQQTGDLRVSRNLGEVGQREFLHIWGKIERAYGIYAWQHKDWEGVARHFTWACAFLEEYSNYAQTFRDTLDLLTDILSTLSTDVLNTVVRHIESLREQFELQKYTTILERIEAATGIIDHLQPWEKQK